MGRILGSIAIFAGWASIPIGAFAGLAASKFLGLNAIDDSLPPTTVYGMSAAVVLWAFVAGSLVSAIPLARAMFSVGLQRSVYATAIVMAVTGAALIPDELGRAFGIPILLGAGAVAFGGQVLRSETAPTGGAAAAQSSGTQAWIFNTIEGAEGTEPTPATTQQPEPPPTPRTTKRRRKPAGDAAEMKCQWCSAVVLAGATSCPSCNAPFTTPDHLPLAVPGVTEVLPGLRAYDDAARRGKRRPSLLRLMFNEAPVPQAIDAPPPSDDAALRPPSPELRAEMARLDAEIASGNWDPGGDQSSGTPSPPPDAAADATPSPPADAAADATVDAAAAKASPTTRGRNPRT